MTSVSKRLHSRRRLAALTFLSNISLDGTHRDTTLGTLNFNFHFTKSNNENRLNGDRPSKSSECWVSQRATKSLDSDRRVSKSADDSVRKTSLPEKGNANNVSVYRVEGDQLPSKHKDRVHKFMSDAKARLCNLSQKRKHLLHQKSTESYGLSSGKSTESLATLGSRSRKASLCPSECSFPAAVEIRYLKNLKDKRIHNERIVLVSTRKAPFVLFSILPYRRPHSHGSVKDTKNEGSRRHHASSMRQLSIINDGPDPLDLLALLGVEKPQDGQDISFSQLLDPSAAVKKYRYFSQDNENPFKFPYQIHNNRYSSNDYVINASMHKRSHSLTPPKNMEKSLDRDEILPYSGFCHVAAYNPNLLDDPELIAGKHSTLLVFPSYITSVIDYVKPSDLKKDLNDKFKERFPCVQLTLSKLRSLKREMYKIAHECGIDISIVAQAFVYFEKLILKVLVNKQNRKLCAGACLLLSAKLNDVRGADLHNLIERIETVFRINRKDLMNLEFGILVALEFSLLLSSTEILPHYQRLLYES